MKEDWQKEIEAEIKRASAGIKNLRSGALSDRALEILIQNACGTDKKYRQFTRNDIKQLLDGIESMEKLFLRKARDAKAASIKP